METRKYRVSLKPWCLRVRCADVKMLLHCGEVEVEVEVDDQVDEVGRKEHHRKRNHNINVPSRQG
jgi:hypothetical protein